MKNIESIAGFKQLNIAGKFVFSLGAALLIAFLPALSHMLSLPLYLLEPLRMIVILSLLFGNFRFSLLMAFLLPLFSYQLSAHPILPKMGIIIIELALNVWLFRFFLKTLKNTFASLFISIIISKIAYYFLKYSLIILFFEEMRLIATPIYLQLITALILTFVIGLFLRKRGFA